MYFVRLPESTLLVLGTPLQTLLLSCPLPVPVAAGAMGGLDRSLEGTRKAHLLQVSIELRALLGPGGSAVNRRSSSLLGLTFRWGDWDSQADGGAHMLQMRPAWHEGLERDAKGLLSRCLSGALREAKDS